MGRRGYGRDEEAQKGLHDEGKASQYHGKFYTVLARREGRSWWYPVIVPICLLYSYQRPQLELSYSCQTKTGPQYSNRLLSRVPPPTGVYHYEGCS